MSDVFFFTPDLKLSFHCYFTHMQNLKIPEFRSRCWWSFNNTLPLLSSFDFRLKLTNSPGNTKDQGKCFTIKLDATNLKDKMKVNGLNVETAGCFTADFLLMQNAPTDAHTLRQTTGFQQNACLFPRSLHQDLWQVKHALEFRREPDLNRLQKSNRKTPSYHFPLFPFLKTLTQLIYFRWVHHFFPSLPITQQWINKSSTLFEKPTACDATSASADSGICAAGGRSKALTTFTSNRDTSTSKVVWGEIH